MIFQKTFLATFIFFALSPAYADSILDNVTNSIETNWDKSMSGQNEFYMPLHTWHNRRFYNHNQISNFNENPWGFGFGKSYKDEDKNWHGFYAMIFQDSHTNIEPLIGYGYTKNWYRNDFFVGAGYTLVVTARKDISNYTPIPGILPLVSVGYKNFTLMGTYIPPSDKKGNFAFFWGTYAF